jgi:phospholipase C
VRHLLSLPEPRTDCPQTLVDPARPAERAGVRTEPASATPDAADAPVPTRSNAAGFLGVLLKTELELAGDDEEEHRAVTDRFGQLTTMGDAVDYLRAIGAKLDHRRSGTGTA